MKAMGVKSLMMAAATCLALVSVGGCTKSVEDIFVEYGEPAREHLAAASAIAARALADLAQAPRLTSVSDAAGGSIDVDEVLFIDDPAPPGGHTILEPSHAISGAREMLRDGPQNRWSPSMAKRLLEGAARAEFAAVPHATRYVPAAPDAGAGKFQRGLVEADVAIYRLTDRALLGKVHVIARTSPQFTAKTTEFVTAAKLERDLLANYKARVDAALTDDLARDDEAP